MIRCKCGREFLDACDHAAHKVYEQFENENLNHLTVCSYCGKEFKSYPIEPEDADAHFDIHNRIVTILCHDCK